MQNGGVAFHGTLQNAYRLCLWSRTGSRVLLKLSDFDVSDYDALYRGITRIDWSRHMDAGNTMAIDCFSNDAVLNNSHFAILRIKDAIVDQLRTQDGQRPDIVKQQPDIRINAHIHRGHASIYLDLSGDALHRRGYRCSTGAAPLRETLAAAMLYRAKWPQHAAQGMPLLDCMCGSGTLLIEGAMMAAGQAPGLLREHFGFLAWKQHDNSLWQQCLQQARSSQRELAALPTIQGYDLSGKAVSLARRHIAAAGLDDVITVQQADCTQPLPSLPQQPGLLICNPPYGKRIAEVESLKPLYYRFGQQLRQQFSGWQVAIITPEKTLAQCIGLRAHRRNSLYNGALKCTLYQYAIRQPSVSNSVSSNTLHENVAMFTNRLTKNLKHLKKWARRNAVSCYRVYDADIPQYAVAVDIYDEHVLVYEYQAPGDIHPGKAMQRLNDVVLAVQQVMQVPAGKLVLKTRKKQSGSEQYQLLDNSRHFITVTENGLQFLVNLHDYLDTGLFLDHRQTRQMVRRWSDDKDMLNLFAYTGSFTVYAAAGGARSTTTVDLSRTYLQWAEKNLALNSLAGSQHRFIRDDCLQWLRRQQGKQQYDIIVLDPPTFSNSKRMQQTLDIQRDHVELIQLAMAMLRQQGRLLFSTNARRFKLDQAALQAYTIDDISAHTLSEDFRRKPAHHCWQISHGSMA